MEKLCRPQFANNRVQLAPTGPTDTMQVDEHGTARGERATKQRACLGQVQRIKQGHARHDFQVKFVRTCLPWIAIGGREKGEDGMKHSDRHSPMDQPKRYWHVVVAIHFYRGGVPVVAEQWSQSPRRPTAKTIAADMRDEVCRDARLWQGARLGYDFSIIPTIIEQVSEEDYDASLE